MRRPRPLSLGAGLMEGRNDGGIVVLGSEAPGCGAHRGVGASSRTSLSAFRARQTAAGGLAFTIAAFRLASLARCAPAMTLKTAG